MRPGLTLAGSLLAPTVVGNEVALGRLDGDGLVALAVILLLLIALVLTFGMTALGKLPTRRSQYDRDLEKQQTRANKRADR